MHVEYAGRAERWAGPGVVHEVRALWSASEATEGEVKRAAIRELRREAPYEGRASVIDMDTDTYKWPRFDAIVRIRVLSLEDIAYLKRRRAERYPRCVNCADGCPGYLVRMEGDGCERALCYGCWQAVRGACLMLHWIDRNGRLQLH